MRGRSARSRSGPFCTSAGRTSGASRRPRVAILFPGLGSRNAYRELGRALLDRGIPEVVRVYHEAALALGSEGHPERLLFASENLPEEPLERQGFLGAAFLVHNLALEAYLRSVTGTGGVSVNVVAYTGESLGILAAAVAAKALSVGDGVRIAHAFTPLMLVASEGAGSGIPLATRLASYLPGSVRRSPLAVEPSHVVALRGEPTALRDVLESLGKTYPTEDVEIHKVYSWRQVHVYVRASVRAGFDRLVERFPAVDAEDLKPPTTFLAHSERMQGARRGLERFFEDTGITFRDPRTPVVANHRAGMITDAVGIRNAVLALADEAMASRSTASATASLLPDAVVEVGLGGRSLALLADNGVDVPAMAWTGTDGEADTLVTTVSLVGRVVEELRRLQQPGGRLGPEHTGVLRELFRAAARDPFCERYVTRTVRQLVADEMLRPGRDASPSSPAFREMLEILQNTVARPDGADVGAGELVVRSRVAKEITGPPERAAQPVTRMRVIDAEGVFHDRTSTVPARPEAVVLQIVGEAGGPSVDLDAWTRDGTDLPEPALQVLGDIRSTLPADGTGTFDTGLSPVRRSAQDRVLGRYALAQVLRRCRPGLLAPYDYYLEGDDPLGWAVVLAVSEALSLAGAVDLYAAHLRAGTPGPPPGERPEETIDAVLGRILPTLRPATVPVVSPDGTLIRTRRDLEAATRVVFPGSAPDGASARASGVLPRGGRPIRLGGTCLVVSLGAGPGPGTTPDTGPFPADVVTVRSPVEIWTRLVNLDLDRAEDRAVLSLTGEHLTVLRYARERRVLTSSVYAYVEPGERVEGFGEGGSESMTIFLRRDGESRTTVRKILSDALVTAQWDPHGRGVMLPPFAKAWKQAEYLQALPEPVDRYFPAVHDVVERDVPVPSHLATSPGAVWRESIYEMDYVEGQEVSRFVERFSPPPEVIARLYEQILVLLDTTVHSVNRVPAPGSTLEASYFTKIEERLDLCRRTAPRTFGPDLLDAPRIVVNGVPYLNHKPLLERFRRRPGYRAVLEPPFHSLVMGDTNTENVKILSPEPLLHAQRLIESHAARAAIDEALAAITAESLGIRFLDPRAIGFDSAGRTTRDDPMYDNKPWHNSLGHYDEIHYEQFSIRVRTPRGRTPHVDIDFLPGNPYRRAYRVRDVVATGGIVTPDTPQGIEDYFASVMRAVHGEDGAGPARERGAPAPPDVRDDPFWLVRFVFVMGTHFAAMPPFHFRTELDGTLTDSYRAQRRPVAIYCEGIKWLNWALEMLEGRRTEFLGVPVPDLPPGGARRFVHPSGRHRSTGHDRPRRTVPGAVGLRRDHLRAGEHPHAAAPRSLHDRPTTERLNP